MWILCYVRVIVVAQFCNVVSGNEITTSGIAKAAVGVFVGFGASKAVSAGVAKLSQATQSGGNQIIIPKVDPNWELP